jgi:hypothetical protein
VAHGKVDVLGSDAAVADDAVRRDLGISLLRAFEPIVRYTRGELFFPTAVGPYVERCSLWASGGKREASVIVPAGELTLEWLAAEGIRHRDRPLYLRFVEEPLSHAEYVRWRMLPRDLLTATGRFKLIAERTCLLEERRAHLASLSEGLPPEPPKAHLHKTHRPYLDEQERQTHFLKIWAAISTPLLLSSVILILVVSPLALLADIGILACVFLGFEAIARRRFLSFLGSLVLLVAVVAIGVGLIVLFITHWRVALSLVVGVAALALLVANLRAIRRT